MKNTLVIGSTGLVGSHLVRELEAHAGVETIRLLVRKSGVAAGKKTEVIVSDFSKESLSEAMQGISAVFICLGTTIKKAGSIQAMEAIDRDLPIQIASFASQNGVKQLAAVSSVGANAKSGNYYLRIKGEMEQGIQKIGFENLAFVRPSLILGDRNEKRFGESFAKVMMRAAGFLFVGKLRKYKAIHARTIARAMIHILEQNKQETVYESDALQVLGQ